jgi:peptide deformylase
MPVLEILHYPDPRLRTRAQPVQRVDDEIRALVRAMFETMYRAPGIGLAATQVNVHKRLLVCDVSDDHSRPLCLINPEIVESRGTTELSEGCLSVPDVFEPVVRADWVRVNALNADGAAFTIEAEGLLAVCIQHEIDHLEPSVVPRSAAHRFRRNTRIRSPVADKPPRASCSGSRCRIHAARPRRWTRSSAARFGSKARREHGQPPDRTTAKLAGARGSGHATGLSAGPAGRRRLWTDSPG